MVSPQGKTTTYRYNAVGNRDSVISPNSVTTGYQYDALNRLTRVRHYKAGSVLAHYAYALNAAGIRTQLTEKDSSKAFFAYDSLYRLKSERRTGNHTDTMTYTYDPVGNRLTKARRGVTTTYTYNNRDQMLSEWDGTDSTLYSYDAAGRMLTKAEVGGTTHYRWRDEDRLDSLYGPGVSVKYQYDADGRRVKDSTGSTVRQYLIDPLLPYGQVIAETDGSNSLVAEYVVGIDRVSLRRSSSAHYYLTDGQGSTRLLTDSTGTVTDSTVYTAFGETLFSSGSTPNGFLYTGEQLDGNSGLYYNRARWMEPKVGRFLGVDRYEGDPQTPISLHRYLYANASPISMFDPTGESTLSNFLARAAKFLPHAIITASTFGNFAHEAIQKDVEKRFDAKSEVNIIGGRADIIISPNLVYEIKPFPDVWSARRKLRKYERNNPDLERGVYPLWGNVENPETQMVGKVHGISIRYFTAEAGIVLYEAEINNRGWGMIVSTLAVAQAVRLTGHLLGSVSIATFTAKFGF